MKKLTIFSWGFWGWGTHAESFVKVVDHVEASRGFKPPIFVDIRIRRTGRAPNFRENTFREIVGEKRYQWMRGLGNAAIIDNTLGNLSIKDPREAKTLLDLAIDSMKHDRRIIFYCACEFPSDCHRYIVGDLLLKEAKKRKIALEVVEWPGGNPQHIKEKTSEDLINKIRKRQKNYPLSKNADLVKYGSLAWGSIVTLSSGADNLPFVGGPIKYINGGWALPVAILSEPNESIARLKKYANAYIEYGYNPRSV